jgi:methyl-accepting chemotaxis protein
MKLFGSGARAGAGGERQAELEALFTAIDRAQAVAEFGLDGSVLNANDNFLGLLGYSLAEVRGRSRTMFLRPEDAQGEANKALWRKLEAGEPVVDLFLHVGRGGQEVWLRASYCPVLGPNGRPSKVVQLAADVTRWAKANAQSDAERHRTEEEQTEVLTSLGDALKRLADGDVTSRIDRAFTGQYEEIRANFNAAADSLREAMGAIGASAHGIRSGAAEIANASDDLSRRTEQQAASLEETAAALDELTETVRRSAEGAKRASNHATGAREDAARSGQVMRDAVTAMGEIEHGASKISQIIGVIDEIAFQTNLLALNAGVEAARAGDAGKGFAVVAQEVRALAQRSAEAAKEIKALISASSDQVGRGVRLVGDAGSALDGIVAKVAEIDGLISEISISAQEQATGLNEVNAAVNQMDQVTQQNAAMVEEATAAAANLRSESAELARLVARFSAGQHHDSSRPELADPARHAPGPNPVAKARARVSAFARSGGAQPAVKDEWEEF